MLDSTHRNGEGRQMSRLSQADVKNILVVTVSALVISGLLTIYDIGYVRGWKALYVLGEHQSSPHSGWPYSIIALRIGFVAALAVSIMGIRSRTFRGVMSSFVALLFVVVGYVWWYFDSLRLLRNLEIADYSQLHIPDLSHVGGLREGTWWDITFLAVIILLLLWHLRTLFRLKSGLV